MSSLDNPAYPWSPPTEETVRRVKELLLRSEGLSLEDRAVFIATVVSDGDVTKMMMGGIALLGALLGGKSK